MYSVPGFEIKELLHESDRSLVVRAGEGAGGRPVLLKFLNRQHPGNAEIERFRHEYEVFLRLKGIDGIAGALALKEYGNLLFIMFEDAGGESLEHHIGTHHLSLRSFLSAAAGMADTLHSLHTAGVVHRDINPSHYLYDRTYDRAYLIDLGTAAPLAKDGVVCGGNDHDRGLLAYISPERTGRMNRRVDWRTDLYSLGVTLYEMLAGRLPFESTTPLEIVHAHIAREPVPPCEIRPGIPPAISAIIMKLLSKDAGERYQSAAGVRADLERCLTELEGTGMIEPFPIALKDVPDRFLLPSKLYGRDTEVRRLVSCYNRIASGARKMVLVSGPPGIGKTALVNEIQDLVIGRHAYFISSKFDQFARSTPYSAIIGALRELVHQLLPERDENLEEWRRKVRDIAGPNGRVLIDLIPELELIIGPQPPVITLKPEESRNRFRVLFYNFTALFCTREHPLVLFLDDVQWADLPSLTLIETMMGIEDGAFMLVLAYRDNEVDGGHPFAEMVRNIPAEFREHITVGPLTVNYTADIIADIVHQAPVNAGALADLVQEKTGGNPFFVGEFLKALNEEGLLVFDPIGSLWRWNVGEIHARSFTSNVGELVAGKIRKLRGETQAFLRYASMLGNTFDLARVAMLAERPAGDIVPECAEAVREGFIFGLGGNTFSFAHDRIQQGAYGMIREDELPAEHLRAGRLLLAGIPEDELDESLFAVLDQYNKGSALVVSAEERVRISRLNHGAGQKARQMIAFDLAYKFLRAGIDLLDEASWENEYDLTLALYSGAAETACLSGNYTEMQRIGGVILERGRTLIDKVPLHIANIIALSSQAKFRQALDAGLEILDGLGFHIPRHPRKFQVVLAFTKARARMRWKTPEEIAAFPELKDERLLAIMGLVDCLINAAFNGSPEILALLNFKSVCLLLKHKVSCRYSRMLLCMFGMVFLVSMRGKVEFGREVERLYELLGCRPDAKADEAAMQFAMAFFYFHRVDNIRATLPICREAYRIGLEYGNFTYAANSVLVAARNMLLCGEELRRCERFISGHIPPLKRLKQDRAVSGLQLSRQFIAGLRVPADHPFAFHDSEFREDEIMAAHELKNDSGSLFDIYFLKMILCYLFGFVDLAGKNSRMAFRFIESRAGSSSCGSYYFYDSLINLAVYETGGERDRREILRRIRRNNKFLLHWARHGAMNYAHKMHLIDAGLASRAGHIASAADHYDRAIKLAGENGYLNEEALANELAGRFYLSLGRMRVAAVYLAEAHYLYGRWGATAKVKQLEAAYPKLMLSSDISARPVKKPGEGRKPATKDVAGLDLTSVMKASQAISGEIVLERLVGSLMMIVMENAGANRGALILKTSGRFIVRAKDAGDGTSLYDSLPLDDCADICSAVVRYADRTSRPVILSDASQEGNFMRDTYVMKMRPLSILCMPIIRQATSLGLLYLENTSVTGAFTPERVEVLAILSSQIAISLQNAALYANLKEAEEHYSSIVENAAEGIFQSDLKGGPLLINPALSMMLGRASPAEFIRMVPDLYAEIFADPLKHTLFLDEIYTSGTVNGFEFTAIRLDGTPLEFTMNAHIVKDAKGSPLYVEGMIQDVTEKKRAQQLRIAKEAAEAATRARGEFLARMSHEIRTPMNAIIGFSGLMSRAGLDTKQSGYVSRIRLSAKILLQLINDILEFAKIEAGKLKVESVPFAFFSMIGGLTDIMSVLASEKGIGVISDISPDIPPHVKGDPYRLTQVLTNIINNAVKFTSEGYVLLKVEAISRDSTCCRLKFTVKDTGIGMTADQLAVIFDAFAQADDSITRRYGGTGLGLAISRHLLELMGSELKVASEPGKGTEFTFEITFSFPGKDEQILDFAGSLAPDIKEALSGIRVLLAEDNQVNAEVATEILKEAGASVTHVLNGREALAMALSAPCDVILMDIEMPVMGGYEATRLLRQKNITLPVIAMTAHAMGGSRETCLEAGMNDYISKPIEPHLLVRMLSRWTTQRLTKDTPVDTPAPSVPPPRLPGIDMDAGIRRLMGKEDLYKKLLVGFFRKNVSVPDDIRTCLEKGDRDEARTLAHTLKGTASTMSAHDVHRTALSLETALGKGQPDCDGLIEKLERVLREGLKATERFQ